MDKFSLPVYSTEGKEVETIILDGVVFDGTVHTASMYQTVNAFRASQRKGTASTKNRGEVSGGGKKPWRQKGTGRARVGSNRSPLWRHGGVTFGPKPRDFSYELPKKIKILALKSSLNAKLNEKNLCVLDSFDLQSEKTKDAVKIFHALKFWDSKVKKIPKVLLLVEKPNAVLTRTVRNISCLDINLAKDTHTYEVLAHKKVVITKQGLTILTKRLKNA